MKRFFVAMAAFGFALAALTGCTRHGARCGVDFCVCGAEEEAALREIESDLVAIDNAPEPIDKYTERTDAAAAAPIEEDAPDVVVPEKAIAAEAVEAAEEAEIAEAIDAAEPAEDVAAVEEEFSAEEMAQKIRDIEESTKNEPQIIQDIIDEGYDEVPAVVSEAPAVTVEILPTEAAEAPAIEPVIAESVQEKEELSFLLPPPLTSSPEPGPASFAAEVGPDRSDATEDLTLEGLDDMELEFFGSISESLLEADS